MNSDDGLSSPLPELLDAVFEADDLASAIVATTHWWRRQRPDRPLVIGVLGDDPLQLITATGRVPLGSASVRELLTRQLGTAVDLTWIPLGHQGDIIGGLVLSVDVNESLPSLWIDVTSRLLANARKRNERLQNAKLASLAEYAAGAGHEINNPLATIIGRTRELISGETDPERCRILQTIGAQAWRIRDMIGDTMLFARPPEPKLASVNLSQTVTTVLSRFEEEVAERNITIGGSRLDTVTVVADETQLAIVVSELLRNALRAVPEAGRIDIDVTRRVFPHQSVAELTVHDNGPGLSDKDREHLFDPFYSGRSAGRGLGFGLSKCWRIVTLHGGTVRVGSTTNGTKFVIRWPEADEAAESLPIHRIRDLG